MKDKLKSVALAIGVILGVLGISVAIDAESLDMILDGIVTILSVFY